MLLGLPEWHSQSVFEFANASLANSAWVCVLSHSATVLLLLLLVSAFSLGIF
jgi:hypothetical protein